MDAQNTIPTTFRIGGALEVSRLGYGAMRLTGQPSNFGPYPDQEGGKALLRLAVELGVDFFDTALPYGPGHSERILAEAIGIPAETLGEATTENFYRLFSKVKAPAPAR